MKHSLRSGCLQTRGLRVFGVTFLFVSLSAFCARAQSGSYHFVKIVDNLTVRPDTGATFQFNNGLQSEARLDAGTVVFRTAENDSIWVANSDGTGLRKLVDLTTPAPGGTSVFRELGIGDGADEPLIKDGTVVFPGTINTSSANVYITGLYSIPVAGGAVTRIADSQTVVPDGDGTAFENFGSNTALAGNFSVSAGKIAFNALTDKGDGVYLASVHGSGLTALADGYHPVHPGFTFPVNQFLYPAISNGTIAFYGGTTQDASNGYNALYSTTGGFVEKEVATSNQVLPGDATASPHTRYDAGTPPLVFDGTRMVFVADDADSPGAVAARTHFTGLYSLPAAGGVPVKIVDNKDTLPGLDASATYSVDGMALDGGLLAFSASDSNNNYGVYVIKEDGSGPIVRVLGTGDKLEDGRTVTVTGLLAGGFSQGKIAVTVIVDFPNGGALGIYVATPGPAFFAGETALSNGAYYLSFSTGHYFGYFSYLDNPSYIYHFDLGYEYVFDADDGKSGVYLYDFASKSFFYTSPGFPFPYLYDFTLKAVLYYYPNTGESGHYTTDPRYFYNFATGKIITK